MIRMTTRMWAAPCCFNPIHLYLDLGSPEEMTTPMK